MSSTTVLVIRPGALGDTILTLPVLDTIQAENPDAKITFLGNRSYRDLIPPHIRFEAFDDRTWLWLFNSEEANPPADTRHFDKAYVILNRPEDVVRSLKRAGTETVHSCASLPERGRHVVEHLHAGSGFSCSEATAISFEIGWRGAATNNLGSSGKWGERQMRAIGNSYGLSGGIEQNHRMEAGNHRQRGGRVSARICRLEVRR